MVVPKTHAEMPTSVDLVCICRLPCLEQHSCAAVPRSNVLVTKVMIVGNYLVPLKAVVKACMVATHSDGFVQRACLA